MLTNTKVTYNGSTYMAAIDEPTKCPMCKHAIKPEVIHGLVFRDKLCSFKASVTYLCKACSNTFIGHFNSDTFNQHVIPSFNCGKPLYLAPEKFTPEHFEDFINNLSPNFVKIYNQSSAAQSQGLDEIAGIGYRKALEFLIKDFLIKKDPDNEESIKKTPLGNCVNNFIDNPQLKTAASRAVWLGNDQTHYIQKFTDKDIDDLKRLIRLTVHWISMILETEEASTIQPQK